MNLEHHVPEFTLINAVAAVAIALVFITIMSFLKEPERQKINAIIIAGAGGVYWNGGLGIWEYIFGSVMLLVAFKGLTSYHFIGIGWLLHTGWDVLHHFYGTPIVTLEPSSSSGCAVCDPILAIWFFKGAPSILTLFKAENATSL